MSIYRKGVFLYKGLREFTKSGYEKASANFNSGDLDVDCSDKHYMITGCNSGIGYETALEIAKKGGNIHMVCRNPERANEAKEKLIQLSENNNIFLHTLDLSKPREVYAWAKEWAESNDQLNVLIHNAGCMIHERKLDGDGIEANFATNTLAVHIITKEFVPLMQRNKDPRVIMVSSAGMLTVKLDPEDLCFEKMGTFDGTAAYSYNKRQQVILTKKYSESIDKIHFSSMHPGWADTPAVRTAMPDFYEKMKDKLRSASEGADTLVWLAISDAATKQPGGLFFQDRQPVSTHLPLACTKSSPEDENLLVLKLDEFYNKISK